MKKSNRAVAYIFALLLLATLTTTQILSASYVKNKSCLLRISFCRLREKFGLYLVEKIIGRARIPMSHRSAVLGLDEIELSCIFKHSFSELAAITERPGRGAIVIPFPTRLGLISARFGEGPLAKIVHSYAEHKEIEPLFNHPVNFYLPVIK